jgi:hypothetical protein
VGIDGWSDSTVEQTGTDSDCQGGIPTYYAWYEFYPSASVLISTITVGAGDVISASVSCQTGGLQCTVSIADENSSQSFSYSQTFGPYSAPQISSADWITEAVSSLSGRILPLPALKPVYTGHVWTGVQSSDFATVNGTSGPIGSFGAAVVEIAMVALDGSTVAQPSVLSQDGTSFSIEWSASGAVTVSCSPTPVAVGSATTCEAKVGGAAPTGTVSWSSDHAGKFSAFSCRLSDGTCSVKFTPTAVAPMVVLTAIYGGDFENFPSAGTYSLTVLTRATITAVSCTPKSAAASSSTIIKCKAKVKGYSPTGRVSWSQNGTGSVSLGPASCVLLQGACSVGVTGSAGGQVTISATYDGDSSNQGSSGTAELTIKKASTTVMTSCAESIIGVGANVTCTATVSGAYSSHNGTITWSKASGKGSVALSSTTCTLSLGSCSVTVSATGAGSVKIEAAYGGDADNLGSSGAAGLTITKATTVLTLSCAELSFGTGAPVVCTAEVSGGYQLQSGTVTWSKISGRVTFSSTTCTLSSGSCSVTIVATSAGSVEIKAAYGGDSDNLKSSGTLVLTVS